MSEPTLPERWLPVLGYDYYEVSDRGRVRSITHSTRFSDGRVRVFIGQVKSLCRDKHGVLRVTLYVEGREHFALVHHLVLGAFVGPRPAGMEGCHGNGDASANYPGNLRWDTHTANMRDSLRHGTHTNTNKRECRKEHLLLAPNLVLSSLRKGRRDCLACSRARADQAYAKRKGRLFDLRAAADRHYKRIMDAA